MKASFRVTNSLFDRPCSNSFLLARLPALVDENPLADGPLIKLRSVELELEVTLVAELCAPEEPEEEFVEFVFVVNVRFSTDFPTS